MISNYLRFQPRRPPSVHRNDPEPSDKDILRTRQVSENNENVFSPPPPTPTTRIRRLTESQDKPNQGPTVFDQRKGAFFISKVLLFRPHLNFSAKKITCGSWQVPGWYISRKNFGVCSHGQALFYILTNL